MFKIAERIGVDFDEPQFQPVVLDDPDGIPHTFLIRSILVPTGHGLEAIEKTRDEGQGTASPCSATRRRPVGAGSSPRCGTRSQPDTSGARRSAGS
jgi:hypothetical protein